jgi:hypothetical protein
MSTSASSDKHYTARIIERRDISEGLWLIRVDPGGPYATLGIDHADKRIERAYSIALLRCEEGPEFSTEPGPQGELTPHLDKLPSGDTTLCRKVAKGRFTLDIKSGRTEHLLVAPVTGFAPFVSYGAQYTRIGKAGAVSCETTTSSSVCKEEVGPGSSMSRRVGANCCRNPLVQVRRDNRPVVRRRCLEARGRRRRRFGPKVHRSAGDGDRRLQPYAFVGIPAGTKPGKATFSAPVAEGFYVRRGLFHPGEGSVGRVLRPGRFVMRLTSQGRCTMRPSQNPNPYQV